MKKKWLVEKWVMEDMINVEAETKEEAINIATDILFVKDDEANEYIAYERED